MAGHRRCSLRGIMLLAALPALVSIAMFIATLSLRPKRARTTVLPPLPAPPRA